MPQAPLLLLLLCLPVFAQTGKVVGISDGNTITVLSERKQTKVRLAGIDARERGQDYSDAAKRYLSTLVFGEIVTLDGGKVDRYGRLVAKVMLDGRDINLVMIQNGLAWHLSKYAGEQSREDRLAYSAAETKAREARLNLWRHPNPVAPGDFRSGAVSAKESAPTLRPLDSRPIYQSSFVGQIIGNRNSRIYHFPSCPSYDKVAEKNRVFFRTPQYAEHAGYRVAKSC